MPIIPKFLNKWLTPDEEEQLKIPSRRVFCIGALSTLALAAAPAGFVKLGNIYVPGEGNWKKVMSVNWMDAGQFDGNLAFAPFPSYLDGVIEQVKREMESLTALKPEDLRVRFEDNPHNKIKIMHVEALEDKLGDKTIKLLTL